MSGRGTWYAVGIHDPAKLIRHLTSLPKETEWLEFKVGNFNPDSVGKYVLPLQIRQHSRARKERI